MRSIHALGVALALVLFTPFAFASNPNLQVTADDTTVSVRGATPNGKVLFIGFQRSAKGYETVFRRIERIIEADAAGRADLVLTGAPAHDSYFVAMDLTTGSFGSAVPKGQAARGRDLPSKALIKGNHGRVEAIEADCDHAYVVVLRPSIRGAFRGVVGDGGPTDTDGRANGRVELSAKKLEKLQGNDGPGDNLENGDVVFVFPTHRMTFLVGVVKP